MKRISLIVLVIVVVAAVAVFAALRLTAESRAQNNEAQSSSETDELTYIWKIDFLDIQRVEIALEKEGLCEAWVLHDDQYFYFDEPDGSIVDMDRWGGGVPLLLGGPAATREVADVEDVDQLDIYGLAEPSMRINIGTIDGGEIEVELGDRTPNAMGNYIKLADSTKVFIVDYTWYDVMENLVLDPPYPSPESSGE